MASKVSAGRVNVRVACHVCQSHPRPPFKMFRPKNVTILFRRSLTMPLPFATEKQVALAAVRRACALTSSVFNNLVKNETLTKGDKSPVTGKKQ